MAEKNTKGTEALESAAPKKDAKAGADSKPKGSKKAPKKGRKLHRVVSTVLDDGSVHHEHHYKKADGSPDFQTEEYSSASPEDAGAHVAEAMGAGADPAAGGGDPAAGEEDGEAAAPPAGGAPAPGQ